MPETLFIRLDTETKKRLDALAQRSKRSKSFLAAEAIAQYVEAEEWQLGEIRAGLADLDEGRSVSDERVTKWLKSWGNIVCAVNAWSCSPFFTGASAGPKKL